MFVKKIFEVSKVEAYVRLGLVVVNPHSMGNFTLGVNQSRAITYIFLFITINLDFLLVLSTCTSCTYCTTRDRHA